MVGKARVLKAFVSVKKKRGKGGEKGNWMGAWARGRGDLVNGRNFGGLSK